MAYVYRHIRLDKNVPFYIGIGTNRRHMVRGAGRNVIWNNIVRKTEYEIEILIDDITWGEACEKEKEFIRLYGRINKGTGTLANMTDGGEGASGAVYKDETRQKISAALSGRPLSAERRKKISQATIGRTANNKGRKMPQAQYESMIYRTALIQKRVAKYSLGGNFVCEYKSVISAAKLNNLQQGNITNACNKKIAYGGCIWRYVCEEPKRSIEPHQSKIKPIVQTDLDDNIISEYTSAMEAARKNNWVKSTILRATKRTNNIAYGFKWYKK